MGKIILAGVLMLALAPATLVGLPSKGARLAREAAKLESKYEGQLGAIHESFGGSCPRLSGEDWNDYTRKIDNLNERRARDYRRHGIQGKGPAPYSYCGSEGYGYGN